MLPPPSPSAPEGEILSWWRTLLKDEYTEDIDDHAPMKALAIIDWTQTMLADELLALSSTITPTSSPFVERGRSDVKYDGGTF